ncbi:MAG: protein-(glutamine-N5) methyltransferase, release factor-specific [Actinobacteria bacterium 13_1_20CM_2_65_11]|nr:MAG: protein-(glutamine-N5) methyltransferase, release factor-specific [Chloroflexi bacterium 13_1_40CM_65_17]OLC67667.1 MAG: protein-(glutamine-N5) methyltransferase, release factor-specific [Actinobacteria bacterium 13_1_40CM_4_65_12]OLD26772.1 MAG: protein-(glutamine-N5) methyltransferase, release factor-specific [Chloroflexi bacterium 13_1_40CM_3_65_12]OLD48848.1 MAG: protein-(glutamine-N5) methyltransferase, release factor-specific [Actinobacteria bacterium 13_1_40CM_2_65_8]OLE80214.1 M
MTVIEVLKAASGHLQKHSSDSARLDAEVLLAQALGMRRLDLYLQFDRPLTDDELTKYRGLIKRRAHGDPVAYLVGHKEFMALDFEVTPAVLVPNPDTEVLVQRAVAIARQAPQTLRMADIGTGSGCIAIAIAHYASDVEIWATDSSREALEVAARNVARHRVTRQVHLAFGDLLDPLEGSFDLICANLPYVAPGTVLPPEVTAQPAGALYAERGGAALVLRLLEAAPARLKSGGRVLAEIDPQIVPAVGEAARRAFPNHIFLRDLGGRERVVEAWS